MASRSHSQQELAPVDGALLRHSIFLGDGLDRGVPAPDADPLFHYGGAHRMLSLDGRQPGTRQRAVG